MLKRTKQSSRHAIGTYILIDLPLNPETLLFFSHLAKTNGKLKFARESSISGENFDY